MASMQLAWPGSTLIKDPATVLAQVAAQHQALAAAMPHYAHYAQQYAPEGSLEHLLRGGEGAEHADAVAQAHALAQVPLFSPRMPMHYICHALDNHP